MSPWAVKRLHEFGGDITKFRVVKVCAVGPVADRRVQDRAGRREQPGHFLAGRQDRHPQAGDVLAERSGCLLVFGRPVPGQSRRAGVRRNVQGADQGAAPLADRDAGRQLQGDRRLRRDPVRRADPGALERSRMAGVQEQPQQRGLPRPHLHRQGAVLAARLGRDPHLREAAGQFIAQSGALRAGHLAHDGPVLGAVAPEGAGKLEHLLENAHLRRREPQGHRPEGQELPGVPRLRRRRRGHDRAFHALRLQDPLQGVQLRPP
jgi:hypothetical protein